MDSIGIYKDIKKKDQRFNRIGLYKYKSQSIRRLKL